jgi:hypothetical protein
MAESTVKVMDAEQERQQMVEFYKEALPHAEIIRQKLEEFGIDGLASFTMAADGYLSADVGERGWNAYRLGKDKVSLRKEYKEVIEL